MAVTYASPPLPSLCLTPTALVHRGTGSKRKHIKVWAKLLASAPFDTVVEPFGQGLWVAQALNQAEGSTLKAIIAAESLVDIRSIWMAWTTPWWRSEIATYLDIWQRMPIEESWPQIKSTWEIAQELGEISPRSAAAGLAVRTLTFSGICRDTPGSGHLNIKWNKSQLGRWHPTIEEVLAGVTTGRKVKPNGGYWDNQYYQWLAGFRKGLYEIDIVPDFLKYRLLKSGYQHKWPKSPPACFQVYDDYSKVQYPADTSKTLAVIDPPYVGDVGVVPPSYRSDRHITPAYFGHRPHAQFTYDMAVFSVRAALAAGCHMIIACNYDSDRLHKDYSALASEFGYVCDRTVMRELKGLNNNAKKASTLSTYQDTYWVFSKKEG